MSNAPHIQIIANKLAAKTRCAWPGIAAKLHESGIEFDLCETNAPGDATIRTRIALRKGFHTIAVVGGDGTLSEAAAGFFECDKKGIENLPAPINNKAALAVLPAGTGDDFARGLMGSRTRLEKWIQLLVSHCQGEAKRTIQLVDVIYGACDNYTKAFICLNAATMGIGGETAARVAAQGSFMRRFSGKARFATAALGALAVWRERPVRLLIDDSEIIEGSMNLIAVANGPYAGGGMMLSPRARIDDGKLDVVTASGLTRANVIRELRHIHSGGHVTNPKVRINQARSVRVETFGPEDALSIEADGNLRGRTPAGFRIIPGALKFVFTNERSR